MGQTRAGRQLDTEEPTHGVKEPPSRANWWKGLKGQAARGDEADAAGLAITGGLKGLGGTAMIQMEAQGTWLRCEHAPKEKRPDGSPAGPKYQGQ